ncbi:MAG: transporter substrate-binding domain-containing protein [Hydrogenovibrio sp.]|uniref:HD domain-containing phosphohydrolase n=1 Tax=Hydrogenovibrio sp. TaxID=2065821 RepID=UPI00286FCEB4|nr:transporter substrate-binding domain-containing protein [Hydrogenovibrio sp.]MDR9499941.1 transporter substrate-binding domain-containing protein [Hydrogenovibrio sp.]
MFFWLKRPTVKITIFTHFLILVLLTAGVLITVQYSFNERLAVSAAQDTFNEISERIHLNNQRLYQTSERALSILKRFPGLKAPVSHHAPYPGREAMIQTLQNHPGAYALYVGYANGDFYEIINLKSDPVLYKKLKAPVAAQWGVITLSAEDAHQTKRFRFLDADLNTVDQRSEPTRYRPADRPWYQKTQAQDGFYQSEPYMFTHLNAPGVTYAMPVGEGAVVALDFTTRFLSQRLVEEKPTPDSRVFVFDDQGEILLTGGEVDVEPDKLVKVDRLVLTEKERRFVEQAPIWRVSNQPDWPPFDFQHSGEPRGFSVDLFRLVAAKTGLRFQFINDYTFQALLPALKDGQLDIVHTLYYAEHRAQLGQFTSPIYRLRNALITLAQAPKLNGLDDLKGQTLAMVAGWTTTDYVRAHYPQIKVSTYPDIVAAMTAVVEGQADAVLDTPQTFHYLKQQYQFYELKVNYSLAEDHPLAEASLYALIAPEQKALHALVNRALSDMPESVIASLEQKWGLVPMPDSRRVSQGAPKALLQGVNEAGDGSSGLVTLQQDGKNWLAIAQPLLQQSNGSQYLGVMIPKATMMAPYNRLIGYSILAGLGVLLLLIPLTYWNTTLLVRPLGQLMRMNQRVAEKQFDQVHSIETHIAELDDLSKSLVSMAQSIQEYQKAQAELLESLVELIADAIDEKSAYTGGHCRRVPKLAMMLLDAANQSDRGPFARYALTDPDERWAFELGAWLHDCGKVTTPEFVVDKATKLETLYNRIHEIRTRFEVLWRDAEIACLQACQAGQPVEQAVEERDRLQAQLQTEFETLAKANVGGEWMSPERQAEIERIGKRTWTRHFDDRLGLSAQELSRYKTAPCALPCEESLLNDKPEHLIKREHFDEEDYRKKGFVTPVPKWLYNLGELYNLRIEKGTLTPEERFKIQEHVIMTIKLLGRLPLPDELRNLPAYAGTHHENMDGSGYPCGLTAADMSVPERIMVVADIFEALTASDRPYKQPKSLSQSLKILQSMCENGEIDPDVFHLFLRSGVYLEYAKKHLQPGQIDEVNIEDYVCQSSAGN